MESEIKTLIIRYHGVLNEDNIFVVPSNITLIMPLCCGLFNIMPRLINYTSSYKSDINMIYYKDNNGTDDYTRPYKKYQPDDKLCDITLSIPINIIKNNYTYFELSTDVPTSENRYKIKHDNFNKIMDIDFNLFEKIFKNIHKDSYLKQQILDQQIPEIFDVYKNIIHNILILFEETYDNDHDHTFFINAGAKQNKKSMIINFVIKNPFDVFQYIKKKYKEQIDTNFTNCTIFTNLSFAGQNVFKYNEILKNRNTDTPEEKCYNIILHIFLILQRFTLMSEIEKNTLLKCNIVNGTVLLSDILSKLEGTYIVINESCQSSLEFKERCNSLRCITHSTNIVDTDVDFKYIDKGKIIMNLNNLIKKPTDNLIKKPTDYETWKTSVRPLGSTITKYDNMNLLNAVLYYIYKYPEFNINLSKNIVFFIKNLHKYEDEYDQIEEYDQIKKINDDVLYLYAYYALINENIPKIELLDYNLPTKKLNGGYYFKYLKYKYKYNQLKLQIK